MPALEYVENTVVVCELTLAGVGVEVLVLTEGETEIEVDFDLLFDVAVETTVNTEVELLSLPPEYVFETDFVGVLTLEKVKRATLEDIDVGVPVLVLETSMLKYMYLHLKM